MIKRYLVMAILFVSVAGCVQQELAVDENMEIKEEETQPAENKKKEIVQADESSAPEQQNEVKEEPNVPSYQLTENWSFKPIEEGVNEKVALLTIDDAPDQYALEMAHTLKELEAPAIFFVNGHFLDTEEEKRTLKKIHDMGFAIGNHTYNHLSLPNLEADIQKEEIISLNNLVEKITGERPEFFRAPHGLNTEVSRQVAEEENMLVMNWSYGYDWEENYRTKESIAEIMVNTELLGNGANLLMHDREWTAAGLKDIVTGLRQKGFEILDPSLIQTTTEE